MRYEDLLRAVERFDFIPDRDLADSAIKASLGVLANRLSEDDAREFIEKLPEPLTMEKLRSRQPYPLELSFDQYIDEVRETTNLTRGQAQEVVEEVLHRAHQGVGEDTWHHLADHLPPEWAQEIQRM